MPTIKSLIKRIPYGLGAVFAVAGLIFIVPGGLLVLAGIAWATWGDKLVGYKWDGRK